MKWLFTKKAKANNKQTPYLPAFEVLDEKQNLRLITTAIITIALVVLSLIVWASYTRVDETTATFGEIMPTTKVSIAQHLEGGIIGKVFVEEGQTVKKGEPLIELDATTSMAELQQMQARKIALLLDANRLQNFINDQTPIAKAANHSQHKNTAKYSNIIQQQTDLLDAQKNLYSAKKSVLHDQLTQSKTQIDALKKQFDFLKTKLSLLEKERMIDSALVKNDDRSAKEYLHILGKINQTQADINHVKSEHKKAKHSYYEKRHQLAQLDKEMKETAYQQLVNTNAKLLEVNSLIDKLTDKVKRTQIYAPIAGVVNGLNVSMGNVIPSGSTLLEIVPQQAPLVVQTHIDPKDIGYMHVGDDVKVKVLTYDFARYGTIHGKLTQISANTFTDDHQQKFYRGTIKLDKQFVGHNPDSHHLLLGMSVEADVVTGDKTLLQYLLKPIHLAVNHAFNER